MAYPVHLAREEGLQSEEADRFVSKYRHPETPDRIWTRIQCDRIQPSGRERTGLEGELQAGDLATSQNAG